MLTQLPNELVCEIGTRCDRDTFFALIKASRGVHDVLFHLAKTKKDKFAGAHVFSPEELYDYGSLYPSIMRAGWIHPIEWDVTMQANEQNSIV